MDKFTWPDSREHMERMAKEDGAGDFGDGVHTCSIMCGCFQLRLRDYVEALEAEVANLKGRIVDLDVELEEAWAAASEGE